MLELELVVVAEEQGKIVVADYFDQPVLSCERPEKTVQIIIGLSYDRGFELVKFFDITVQHQLPSRRQIVPRQGIDHQIGIVPEIIP
jgi:hypothetical protein